MDSFLGEFEEANVAELRWLRGVYRFVEDTLCPVAEQSAGQLALAVVRAVQQTLGSKAGILPLGYRLVSVSELVTRQHTLCCSHFTWSSMQYREWIKEAEQGLPSQKALPQAYLLLIGCLTDEGGAESSGVCDQTWKVKDGSGCVHCEILNPSPEWLGQLMLFPSWNYIPQHASRQGQEVEGYLELSATPLPLIPSPTHFDPGGYMHKLVGPREAVRLLHLREKHRGIRLEVCGRVSMLGPQMDIRGKSLFCFCLTEGDCSVPVLVTDPGCLSWQQCMHVGALVWVSGLRPCVLKGVPGRRALCVTPQSCLHLTQELLAAPLPWDTATHTVADGRDMESGPLGQKETEVDTQSDMETDAQTEADIQMDVQTVTSQPQALPTIKTKLSKVISYKGVVSKVLNLEAGLYEIDGKVGLCLAYQPLQRGGRGFRPGAEVELHDVHFLYRPSLHTLPTMLCACLRSSVRVTAFSRLETGVTPCPAADSPTIRLLLERNLGISQYLWLCHCLPALRERLCPRWVREGRVGVVAGRLLALLLPPGQEGGRPRDMFKEMLEEPHHCPLTEYSISCPSHELLSVQDLRSWMERECWHSMSLPSLLPPSAPHLTRAELNPLLAWSVHVLPAWTLPTPKVLVGVFRGSGRGPCIQLVDQTSVVNCVVVEIRKGHGYCAAYNTAWLGCLVCVQRYTLVMERFLTADFPAWTYLDQERYITQRHSRVYIQLCLDDVQVLSPSVAMTTYRSASERGRCGEGEEPREGRRTGGGRAEERGRQEQPGQPESRSRERGARQPPPGRGNRCKRPRRDIQEANRHPESGTAQPAEGRARVGEKEDPSFSGAGCLLTSDPCVSVVLCVVSKEGLAFRNIHVLEHPEGAPGLSLCFGASATLFGGVQRWEQDPKNCPLEERETDRGGAENRAVELQFVGDSVRWYPFLQPGCVYRVVAPHTQDPSVLCSSALPVHDGVQLHSAPCLLVQAQWHFHTLPQENRSLVQKVMSVSDVLYNSAAADLVTFEGVISHRITLLEERGKASTIQSELRKKGVDVEQALNVRLTVQDLVSPGQTVQVYLDLSQQPYLLGLIPGAMVLFYTFQRKVSRVNCVYCRSIPVSCVAVTALGADGSAAPCALPPIMHLGEWALEGSQRSSVGRVRGHVVCLLYLQLCWVCSFCTSVFKQEVCTRTHPPCSSTVPVFQAEAKQSQICWL
ncbi:CST complex subunit CTC1 isoform X2 [Megalops cyprinoides]|uniref:CST complex subunit CTC1 isoform X2 n=1 Tax=Megalops cyprinoides TaxID=118141 RepID=UPI001864E285|nr:CST complex subunit CTC1 isoform X2 [Megalops cyprinoides]